MDALGQRLPGPLRQPPNGQANPRGTTIGYMKKPLADSLREIGVTPADIGHFAMSHSHGDHSGNAGMFAASTLYMQTAEYDAVFGPGHATTSSRPTSKN